MMGHHRVRLVVFPHTLARWAKTTGTRCQCWRSLIHITTSQKSGVDFVWLGVQMNETGNAKLDHPLEPLGIHAISLTHVLISSLVSLPRA